MVRFIFIVWGVSLLMDLVVYIDAIAHVLMLAHVGLTPHFMDLCLGTFDEEFDLVIMHRLRNVFMNIL